MKLSYRSHQALRRLVQAGPQNINGMVPFRSLCLTLAEAGLVKVTVEITEAGRVAHAEGPAQKIGAEHG
jgi:hypothetical protein